MYGRVDLEELLSCVEWTSSVVSSRSSDQSVHFLYDDKCIRLLMHRFTRTNIQLCLEVSHVYFFLFLFHFPFFSFCCTFPVLPDFLHFMALFCLLNVENSQVSLQINMVMGSYYHLVILFCIRLISYNPWSDILS
jgi:hypothetical protein